MAHTLDFAPLTAPVSKDEVDAWRQKQKAIGIRRYSTGVAFASRIGRWIGLLLVFVIVVVAVTSALSSSTGGSRGPIGPLVTVLVVFVCLAVVALFVWLAVANSRSRWALWLRADRFATANGMNYSPGDSDPTYPGMLFQQGSSRRSLDHFSSASGRFFDLGNYQWVTGSGKDTQTHTWGFLAFNLDRRLPNMVLDAKSNNSIFGTNLPFSLKRDQVLSLEGDFDRYFTLYCPKEYERDALYVFTPDLMALLIDEAAPFDVEIVDDWMFVYSATPFPAGDPATIARLFRIIDTVGAKTLTQTDRYVDERVGNFAANVVAPQGARLKRSVSVFSVIVVVLVIAFWIWNAISDTIGGN